MKLNEYKEKLEETNYDVFVTDNTSDLINYLKSKNEMVRIFIDESVPVYLAGMGYETIHLDMIDTANRKGGFNLKYNYKDPKQICLIYVPFTDETFDEEGDAYDDNYTTCYGYDKFDIYSEKDFSKFKLYKDLGECNTTDLKDIYNESVHEDFNKNNYDKIIYRVDTYEGDRTQFRNQCVFFTDDLNYYTHSDTGYKKENAEKYYLNLKDFKVFDPMKEWDLVVNSWADIRTTEEFCNEKGIYITDYLEDVDYDDPNEYHEVLIDTDSLAMYGRDNGYDVTILRDIPQYYIDSTYGDHNYSDNNRRFTEYAVHNSNCIKSVDAKEFNKNSYNINETFDKNHWNLQEFLHTHIFNHNIYDLIDLTGLELSDKVQEEGPQFILPNGKVLISQGYEDTHQELIETLIIEAFTYIYSYDFYNNDDVFKNLRDYDVLDRFTDIYNLIRINPGTSYVEERCYCVLPKDRPTESQYRQLQNFFDLVYKQNRESILVFLGYDSHEYYTNNIISDDIIKSIKRGYNTGTLYESLEDTSNDKIINESNQHEMLEKTIYSRSIYELLDLTGWNTSENIKTTINTAGPQFILPNGEVFTNNKFKVHEEILEELVYWVWDKLGYNFKDANLYDEDNFLDEFTYAEHLIRINPGTTYSESRFYCVLPEERPTEAQYQTLTDFLDLGIELDKVQVLIFVGDIDSKWYNFFENTPDDIIKKIKRCYTTGTLVEELEEDLSKQQEEFFKDSKVRDKDGNLLVCYHGASNPGFKEFNPKNAKSQFGKYKFGKANVNYFTTDKQSAISYTDLGVERDNNVYACYINIVNPYIVNNETESEIKSAFNIKDKNLRQRQIQLFDKLINKYKWLKLEEDDLDRFNDDLLTLNLEARIDDDYLVIYELGNNSKFGFEQPRYSQYLDDELFIDSDEVEEFRDSVIGEEDDYFFTTDDIVRYVLSLDEDYDGIIIEDIFDSKDMFSGNGTDVITLKSSNQIKLINNENPTSSNRIDEKIIYRGEDNYSRPSSNSDESVFFGKFFFGDTTGQKYYELGDSDYGKPIAYNLDDSAKIFKYHSSEDYCIDNNLMNIDDNDLYKLTLANTDYIEDVDEMVNGKFTLENLLEICMEDDVIPIDCSYGFTQLMAKKDLERKGYDGVLWEYEDDLTPEQYQIWNLNKIKLIDKGDEMKEEVLDESLLLEKTRNQLLTKSKTADNYSKNNQSKGKNRYERRKYSRIARSVAQYNEISMDDLFKKDNLQVGIQVQGETNNYIVQLRFEGVIRELAEEVKRNNGKLEFKNIIKAMSKVFNNGDVFINCSCLHPDTKIMLLDGSTPTIKEMCDRFNKGEELWVYSVDKNGDFKPGKVNKVWKTKTTKKFIKITLDDNSEILTTPEHLYMLRSGDYIQAKNLIEGQSLMPLYLSKTKNDYDTVKLNSTNRYNCIYKLIAKELFSDLIEEAKLRVKDSDNMRYDVAIHHKDFNKHNNNPLNLEVMTAREHWDYHASLTWENKPEALKQHIREKARENAYLRNSNPTEAMLEQRRNFISKGTLRNYDDDRKLQQSQIMSATMTRFWYEDEFVEKRRKNIEASHTKEVKDKQSTTHKNLWAKMSDEEYQKRCIQNHNSNIKIRNNKIKKVIDRIIINNLPLTEQSYVNCREFGDITLNKINEVFKSFDNMLNELGYNSQFNHRVLKVEYVELDNTDVYDIKVDKWENFAIDSGVILHNCPDYKYRQSYWATKQGYSIVPELRPSDITNPKDSKGGGCKHILLVLANLDWVMKISSVINNYIKYCQKNLQNAYATYIFPKVYGMPYQKAVQLSLFDDGLLPDDQETLKQVASQNIKNKNKSNLKKPEPIQKGFKKKEEPIEEPVQQEKSKTTGKSPLSTTDKYRYERDKNKEPKFTKQQSLFDMENEEQ